MNRKIIAFLFLVFLSGHAYAAFRLDGSSYSYIPNSSSLDITGQNITLSCWIRFTTLDGTPQIIIGKVASETIHTSPYFSYSLHLFDGVTNTTPRFFVARGFSTTAVSSSVKVVVNRWYHLAGTYDGANAKVYLDGVETGSVAATGNIDGNTSQVRFGANGANAERFVGDIDDMRIYNRTLSASEIETLALSRCRLRITDGLVGWWSMDQLEDNQSGAGTVELDSSGNNNTMFNGVGTGSTWKASDWISYP